MRKKVQANVDTSKSGKYVIGIDLFDELGSMMMPNNPMEIRDEVLKINDKKLVRGVERVGG